MATHRLRTLSNSSPRFAAWAAEFIEDGQRAEVLMVAQTRQGHVWLHHKGEWRLPSGSIEPYERPDDCLAREVQEEFGLLLPVISPMCVLRIEVAVPGVPGAFTSHIFLLDADDHRPRPVAEEGIDEWRAVTIAELHLEAAHLRTLPAKPGPLGWRWPFWGAFRATEHEVVAELLSGQTS